MNDGTLDVIVIGAGSAGLSAALQLGRLRWNVIVFDGGEPRNRFAGHMHGVLGRDHTSPLDLLADGRREVERYGIEVKTDAVATVRRNGDVFDLTTISGAEYQARRVLLATGVRDELPAIDGLAEHWGRGVHHCPFCDGWEYRDTAIGVLAMTADSVIQIQMLRRLSATVTVLTNGQAPFSVGDQALLAGLGVSIDDRVVSRVIGRADADGVTSVTFSDGRTLDLDAIFIRPGPVPLDAVLDGLGAERNEGPGGIWVTVDVMGRTSVPGLWAAGNVVNPMLTVAASIAAGANAGYGLCAELLAEDVGAVAP